MNGAVEATNKIIKNIVQKMAVTYKDWHKMFPFAFHGYRNSIRTLKGATPFSLFYGMEEVLPVEVEIHSLRVMMDFKLDEVEWVLSYPKFDRAFSIHTCISLSYIVRVCISRIFTSVF